MRQKMRFGGPQLRRCDEPVELRADQPAGAQAHDGNARRESAQGPRQHAERHCGGPADADQGRRVRGRQEPRDHAGQGRQGDAALPADPVHADDRRGAGNAGRDLPAVDQPLLHPRPHAREKLRQMVRRAGHQPVHGQLEIGGREHRRPDARRLCAEGPGRRHRHGPRCCWASKSVHTIGYCVAGTTLAATLGYLHARERAGQGQVGDLPDRAGRLHPGGRPQAVHSATRRWRCWTS